MEYGFKVTTHGRELLTACAASGKGLTLTRVAMGSGTVPEGVDLADVHDLYSSVAEGAVARRSHENDHLYLTVQYCNGYDADHGIDNRSVPAFILAEFMVYAEHPQTGEETDLIYGTLGSYTQPVPAYDPGVPVSIFSFPMMLIVSDDIEVTVTAQAGLVTYDDLQSAVAEATGEVSALLKSLPFTIAPSSWTLDADDITGYPYQSDIEDPFITGAMIPAVVFDEPSQELAAAYKTSASSRTYSGCTRLRAKRKPEIALSGTCHLYGRASGGGGGGDYELPTATATRLGGVKIGDGVGIEDDGTISVDSEAVASDVTPRVLEEAATPDSAVDEMLDEVFGESDG